MSHWGAPRRARSGPWRADLVARNTSTVRRTDRHGDALDSRHGGAGHRRDEPIPVVAQGAERGESGRRRRPEPAKGIDGPHPRPLMRRVQGPGQGRDRLRFRRRTRCRQAQRPGGPGVRPRTVALGGHGLRQRRGQLRAGRRGALADEEQALGGRVPPPVVLGLQGARQGRDGLMRDTRTRPGRDPAERPGGLAGRVPADRRDFP